MKTAALRTGRYFRSNWVSDPSVPPLRKMVHAGRLGRKVVGGFYTHTAPKPAS